MQNILGLLLFLIFAKEKHEIYRCALVTRWKYDYGLSLGSFIFIPEKCPHRMLEHEYGHTIQSAVLGPFYIPVIALPSIIWCRIKPAGRSWRSGRRSYYDFFTEKWADSLGHVDRKGIMTTNGGKPEDS